MVDYPSIVSTLICRILPIVRINGVVTCGGNSGQASLRDNPRFAKDDLRLAAYIAVDGVNATIDLLRPHWRVTRRSIRPYPACSTTCSFCSHLPLLLSPILINEAFCISAEATLMRSGDIYPFSLHHVYLAALEK